MPNETFPLSLDKLFSPRSIAVVGASNRPSAYGCMVLDMLIAHRCPLPIYPVNPRQTEIRGLRCYPDLASVPKPVDLAYIALPAALGPEVLEQAAAAGVGAAAIPGSGYADGGPEGEARQARIVEIAKRHGIAICGPNNMGFVSAAERVTAWPKPRGPPTSRTSTRTRASPSSARAARPGSRSPRTPAGLGLAYLVSTGNEANVNAADYLDHFAGHERVDVILVYLETLRDPARFARAAERARGGRETHRRGQGREGARAPSARWRRTPEGVAGEDAVYDAFFRRHGILGWRTSTAWSRRACCSRRSRTRLPATAWR